MDSWYETCQSCINSEMIGGICTKTIIFVCYYRSATVLHVGDNPRSSTRGAVTVSSHLLLLYFQSLVLCVSKLLSLDIHSNVYFYRANGDILTVDEYHFLMAALGAQTSPGLPCPQKDSKIAEVRAQLYCTATYPKTMAAFWGMKSVVDRLSALKFLCDVCGPICKFVGMFVTANALGTLKSIKGHHLPREEVPKVWVDCHLKRQH